MARHLFPLSPPSLSPRTALHPLWVLDLWLLTLAPALDFWLPQGSLRGQLGLCMTIRVPALSLLLCDLPHKHQLAAKLLCL